MILVPITYKGGVYRHDEIIDLIADLGGYVIQKHVLATEVVLLCLVPRDDIPLIERVGKPLGGEVERSPLVGTEIAVVTPSLSIHHLPHPACDIAEYIRRLGAKSNMIGLARGYGKRVAQTSAEEREIINEHDCAVFLLGNFEHCIVRKMEALRRGIDVPIVLTGKPSTEVLRTAIDPPVAGYVGDVGRFMHRTKEADELSRLDAIVAEIVRVLDERREEIAKDPLSGSPARLMTVIQEQIPEVLAVTSPTPITVQIAGLRVKLPYAEFADRVRSAEIEEGITIGRIADVLPSRMRDYILVRIKPSSETDIVV
ncbi:MAG: methanogenesis marker 7 protein [Methanospirillum sp.]|nr:methanogenesis marker 7 protein [Methanospirillum sp.]